MIGLLPSATAGAVVAFLLGVALLAPVGYALLRLRGDAAPRLVEMGTAVGLGACLVLPLVLAESALGGPYLVLPVVAAALLLMRPARADARDLPPVWLLVGLPLALVAFAAAVNREDMVNTSAGLAFRLGFEVDDRVFYGMVGQEMQRAPLHRLSNPVFANVPLQYSLFPSAFLLLLQRYGGAPVLSSALYLMPAAALGFTALALLSLLRELRVTAPAAWPLAAVLVALGGDLSFLLSRPDLPLLSDLERSRHFFVFYSFSAESLYYNTWMLGLPMALAALALVHRWLAAPSGRDLALAGLALAGLWPTKVFAFLGLAGGAFLHALVARRPALLLLPAAAGVLAAPFVAMVLAAAAAREGAALAWGPFTHVYNASVANPLLGSVAAVLTRSTATTPLAYVATALLFLAGGFGVRLVGLPRLARLARADVGGFHGFLAVTLGLLVTLSLLLIGRPNAVDGIQFLTLAQYLLWIHAAPTLAAWATAGGVRRALAAACVALALVSPTRYVLAKTRPDRFAPPGSMDRARAVLPRDAIAACAWLRSHSAPGETVAAPLHEGLYVGALCGRRLLAVPGNFHLEARQADEQRALVAALFRTADPARSDALLDRLGADWVWEDVSQPLPGHGPALALRYSSQTVRLYRRAARQASPGGGEEP
jgi:hypothetical protein